MRRLFIWIFRFVILINVINYPINDNELNQMIAGYQAITCSLKTNQQEQNQTSFHPF